MSEGKDAPENQTPPKDNLASTSALHDRRGCHGLPKHVNEMSEQLYIVHASSF